MMDLYAILTVVKKNKERTLVQEPISQFYTTFLNEEIGKQNLREGDKFYWNLKQKYNEPDEIIPFRNKDE